MSCAAMERGVNRMALGASYMTAAHSLYSSMGFTDVEYYSEAETPEVYKKYIVYMEMKI